MGHLYITGRHIIDDGIAEHIISGVFFFHILGFFADDHGQFAFVVQFLHHIEMAVDDPIGIHSPVHPLGEVHRNLTLDDFFRYVFIRQFFVMGFVVDPQADDVVPGTGQGSQDLHLFQGDRSHGHPGNTQQFFKTSMLDQVIHVFKFVGRDDTFSVFGNDPYLDIVIVRKGYDFHGFPLPYLNPLTQCFHFLCIHCTRFVIKLLVKEGNPLKCKLFL